MTRARSLIGAVVGLMLVATAVSAVWIVVTSGVLWAGTDEPTVRPIATQSAGVEEQTGRVGVLESLQLSQPRDPFRPLVTEDSPIGEIPGVGGEPGDPSDPNGNGNGNGFTPTGTTITLKEIRDVGGTLRATVTVNGTSFDVGVGDTFAGVYKVVSLSETKGVFMFGDTAFELSVGQQILK